MNDNQVKREEPLRAAHLRRFKMGCLSSCAAVVAVTGAARSVSGSARTTEVSAFTAFWRAVVCDSRRIAHRYPSVHTDSASSVGPGT